VILWFCFLFLENALQLENECCITGNSSLLWEGINRLKKKKICVRKRRSRRLDRILYSFSEELTSKIGPGEEASAYGFFISECFQPWVCFDCHLTFCTVGRLGRANFPIAHVQGVLGEMVLKQKVNDPIYNFCFPFKSFTTSLHDDMLREKKMSLYTSLTCSLYTE